MDRANRGFLCSKNNVGCADLRIIFGASPNCINQDRNPRSSTLPLLRVCIVILHKAQEKRDELGFQYGTFSCVIQFSVKPAAVPR